MPIQEAEVAFKQALELLQTGKIQAGGVNVPKEDMDYYTSQWGSNIDKATYLPSFLLTKEMLAEERRQVAVTVGAPSGEPPAQRRERVEAKFDAPASEPAPGVQNSTWIIRATL